VLEVAASLRLAATPGAVPKERIKYVAKPTEDFEPVKGLPGSTVGSNPRFAELVVLGPFIGVGKDLVSFVYFFEFIFSVSAFIAIRMEFHGFLSKSPTDVLFTDTFSYS
jgi:hypothetical protein